MAEVRRMDGSTPSLAEIRALSALISRTQIASFVSQTFNGNRDLYETLGYKILLTMLDYRARFKRNAVAGRIVEAKPQSTWRGGGEIIEDEQPDTETSFEKAWDDLNDRLKLWSAFLRADTLSGLGRYGVLLLGTPGDLSTPVTKISADQLAFVTPFAEDDATIAQYDEDTASPRFGKPIFYQMTRTSARNTTTPNSQMLINPNLIVSTNPISGKKVHYSRIIHIADGLLDDEVYGLPRLERCWNLLDDLEKITGGGSEAFWRRADSGIHFDIDKDMDTSPEEETAMDEEIAKYVHKFQRIIRTRGVKATSLGSDVADFKNPVEAIMSQLSAGTGIPQRILMGSERGQLASTQDDDNWTQRIVDRRRDFAAPHIIRPFVDWCIQVGVLPKPATYKATWPELDNLDEVQKAEVAIKWSMVNKNCGQVVVTPDEIRVRLLGFPPLADTNYTADQAIVLNKPTAFGSSQPPAPLLQAASNKDRFLRKWRCLSYSQRIQFAVAKMRILEGRKA